jgi:5-methylcytosine-specific restriction enzyme subunit McrC
LAEKATLQGVMQGYVARDESLRTIRGRVRMSDQVTHRPGMVYPVEVTYDEYTVDIAENRILRSALRRMLAVPRLEASVRRRLLHLDTKLAEVSPMNRGEQLPEWSPNRLNAGYVPALRISEIILHNAIAEAGEGRLHVASFVVDLAKVFEDFVTIALTEALRKFPGRARRQYRAYLDEKHRDLDVNRIKMFVDVVHEVERMPVLIFDAKYKAASPNGQYPNADHYQMLAYATALGLRHAWLVYAGRGKVTYRNLLNSKIRTVEFPIDLSGTPREVLERVDSVVKEAWKVVLPDVVA